MEKDPIYGPQMDRDIWTTARGSGHPLVQLEGKPLVGATLEIMLGPKNRSGARYFRITLRDEGGKSRQPILLALHHSGPYPSYNWIEVISLTTKISFPEREITLSETEIESLFCYLSDLIPSGGHMMVEYESETWEGTRLSIGCGIPLAATALGSMLFRVGCGVAFKDWYFAEGGSEGSRKLQGYKALNEEHRCTRADEMAAELRSFLRSEEQPTCHQLWEAARNRAAQILSMLPDEVGKVKGWRGCEDSLLQLPESHRKRKGEITP